ncbi:hypothetical protein LINPERPRIM_LOCUS34229 [Linum perenne]
MQVKYLLFATLFTVIGRSPSCTLTENGIMQLIT